MTEPISDTESFFERVADDRYNPTAYTRGPWGPDSQHAGPPAALLGRAVLTRPGAREDMRLARITFEIISPVPLTPLTVSTRVIREGRSVEIVEASLTPEGGREVMRARALRIRTQPGSVPEVADGPALPAPEDAGRQPFFSVPYTGYHDGMEFLFASGSFLEAGPAACWMRMRVPLVAGEKILPLERVLAAADSGNGISNVLDFSTHVFVNPDLSVHLHRHPTGEWVCVEAGTSINSAGIGMTEAALHDEDGPIGRSVQSLFVAPRD
ncbi:thioesterase family protein [Streptomyces albidus (ex Kaewkla and Franco 2022)]|uniref:thioesterase family protein n=1 Tax=Streptomyces albidus (ex Kaewkla and Franco 2022) TaxID=722709 RepID=UPI0028151FBF|nr:thioesterase family protein [Streptomyces albidus (ex Kaewkla and Franco 2022)]